MFTWLLHRVASPDASNPKARRHSSTEAEVLAEAGAEVRESASLASSPCPGSTAMSARKAKTQGSSCSKFCQNTRARHLDPSRTHVPRSGAARLQGLRHSTESKTGLGRTTQKGHRALQRLQAVGLCHWPLWNPPGCPCQPTGTGPLRKTCQMCCLHCSCCHRARFRPDQEAQPAAPSLSMRELARIERAPAFVARAVLEEQARQSRGKDRAQHTQSTPTAH